MFKLLQSYTVIYPRYPCLPCCVLNFPLEVQKRSGVQHSHQKKNLRHGRKAPHFPPIRPLDGVGQRIASAREHRIKELSSQVWELQQQLKGALQENRLLRRVQSRHTVALQQFQDSQSGLPQVCSFIRVLCAV